MSDQAVAEALAELPRHAWTVVRRPYDASDAPVDAVVVGPRGAFVVGSLPDGLDQLREARQTVAEAVAPVLGPERVYAVHCLPGQASTAAGGGVLLTSPDQLVDTLVRRRGVISPQQVIQACLQVDEGFVASVAGGTPTGASGGSGAATATLTAPAPTVTRTGRGRRLRELTGLLALTLVVVVLTVVALLQG